MPRDLIDFIDPEIAKTLRSATNQELRSIALRACRFALDRVSLTNIQIANALRAIEAGDIDEESLRPGITALVEELDSIQFSTQEQVDAGIAEDSAYVLAFCRARAANAVLAALSPDVRSAATEVIYEVEAATEDDVKSLRQAILSSVGSADNCGTEAPGS